ncbi:MAG: DUF86 domain-containing protein [Bacteroidetes bacterium]|nr:DUF86 domain-containing protein [Bacteroidota bacterium]
MKRNKPNEKDRISHIIEAIQTIKEFTKDCTSADFPKDTKTYSAVLYQFTVIGEAVGQLPHELLKKYEYPWNKVKSFRNFILHEYHAVDKRVIWDTTILILPGLNTMMETIIKNEFTN